MKKRVERKKWCVKRWGVYWWSDNRFKSENLNHIVWDGLKPLLFFRKSDAKKYIDEKYGYIKHRKDLRNSPHWWRLPKAVKVSVHIELV